MWWIGYGLIIGIEGDLRVHESKEMKLKTISYFHQKYWGGAPYETTGIGEIYLGGLIYKTNIDTTYFADYYFPNEVDSLIELPKNIHPKDLVLVWKGQNLMFIYSHRSRTEKLYPLKYKSN